MEPDWHLAEGIITALRAAREVQDLEQIMEGATSALGCRFWALVHHEDLRTDAAGRVNIKRYPDQVVERIIGQGQFRRDPVMRACLFSDAAFVWSEIPSIIQIDRKDRAAIEFGMNAGLNEGITVPSYLLGDCIGSCTFAGMACPDEAYRCLGFAQMVGTFAFQAARRICGLALPVRGPPRLHPRPRECIVLAGQGLSNKEIARSLLLTPRTVDGYLTEARRLFDAHDRTELVVSAVLAGEIGVSELRRRQPEHSLGLRTR